MFGMIPFNREENSLFQYLDNMEKNLFGGLGDVSRFRCDIQDKGDSYLMEAELPGFEKEDISVDVDGERMQIVARHNSEKGEKDDKGNYLRRERRFGSFSRSFDVTGIDTDNIKAVYKNGVLELTLPKKEQNKEESTRSIEIEG
ncbi:MAG: Hsp20/alpha crystallin family protein [Candidatus Fournierella pullistercoris]|uniref:Hsp20/alpha crystallin family protein n=1 Tax=Candidatus Allofournierella pullistercoris TaxID=2838597 RepID=A0A948T0V9_9FIRM|nr:Hsp20/alpha crystallin family protein [Candidatus Fournierella pullistercoris]